ncbi:hypothetical protein MAR_025559 [Mya arenaria]|uniref:Uncharacterized protein n=1 Tax=Mya arenaria TaxID=6604 RepID=A0ABY7ER04_MYAAR|nr:hypothetical protein MAR_025559 [Mya arenaria]
MSSANIYDSCLQRETKEQCRQIVTDTITLLNELGLTINTEKSSLADGIFAKLIYFHKDIKGGSVCLKIEQKARSLYITVSRQHAIHNSSFFRRMEQIRCITTGIAEENRRQNRICPDLSFIADSTTVSKSNPTHLPPMS